MADKQDNSIPEAKEIWAILRATAKRQEENSRQIAKQRKESDHRREEAARRREEADRRQEEADRRQEEADRRLAKTERLLRPAWQANRWSE